MATIDNKQIIDEIIRGNGFYQGDERVFQIVEYTNAFGVKTWGVTWERESLQARRRYELPTYYVREPKVIWSAMSGSND